MAETNKNETNADENVIFVGNKPLMSYVLAVVTEFKKEGTNEVVIKARGRAISRAVDTAEIARKRFIPDVEVKEIKIGTENITNAGDATHNVSSIEIHLVKK